MAPLLYLSGKPTYQDLVHGGVYFAQKGVLKCLQTREYPASCVCWRSS